MTPAERERAEAADLSLVSRALVNGATIVDAAGLPGEEHLPPYLFAWGQVESLRAPRIAIVGTRHASAYGRAVAQKFAEAFARAGVTVVSGGAHGIDAAAHKGALAADGITVAVMLTGIERVYPLEHRGLFQQIRQKGCLLSQFAVGAQPGKFRPLMRNRTIAALSQAVLVVEAPAKSGSLNTATAAAEIGVPLFVVPANIDAEGFRGSHALIREVATLVEHPDQVLMDLGIRTVEQPKLLAVPENEVQAKILAVLSTDPMNSEKIAQTAGLSPDEVLSELTMLELEGLVLRDGAGYVIKP